MGELYQPQAGWPITSMVHQTCSAITGVMCYDPYWQPCRIDHVLGVKWCVKSHPFRFYITIKNKPLSRRGIIPLLESGKVKLLMTTPIKHKDSPDMISGGSLCFIGVVISNFTLPVLGIVAHKAGRKLKQIEKLCLTAHCIVFLNMTCYSHSVSLHPDIQMGTGWISYWG